MRKQTMNIFLSILAVVALSGCIGTTTFHDTARAGDTVALAAGWKHYYSRDNITVTITPSSGSKIVLLPNDLAVRAVVNLYPDPVSSVIVSPGSGQDLTPSAQNYASAVNNWFTFGDKDWWETTVYLDLPGTLPTGTTAININNPQGESFDTSVAVVAGTGHPIQFQTTIGALNVSQLAALERVGHYTVSFSGSTTPFAIQLSLSHNPDMDNGGVGRAYVVNPRGDLKNVVWRDDGTTTRVILTPTKGQPLASIKDFKFYVAGGVTALQLTSIKAVNINGSPVMGVTANIVSGY
jgi:hypothetical protein